MLVWYEHVAMSSTCHRLTAATVEKPARMAALAILITEASQSRQHGKSESSAKQSTTAMSSTEAEYIVVAEASMEAVWMRKFIDRLRDVMPSNKRPIDMLCDNVPAIATANDIRIMRRARRYQRKHHYIREVILAGEILQKESSHK
uniref:Retrovirus-related Pol polyprotein from transposon TNT 1-94 n=1 Tax=Tanacetum cinerariifolium TaxID=118510 RepID=A0A699HCP8_TANCI|nr:hypothetical protein [Tanacetum cinerariifolium]